MAKSDIKIMRMEGPDFRGFDDMKSILADFNEKKLGTKRKVSFIAAYEGVDIIGGIFFRWYGSDAFVDFLAVHDDHRHQGIGSRLIQAMEQDLTKQGCKRIFVDTERFQAPDFYQGMGYKLVATTPEHLGGHDRLTFKKDLQET